MGTTIVMESDRRRCFNELGLYYIVSGAFMEDALPVVDCPAPIPIPHAEKMMLCVHSEAQYKSRSFLSVLVATDSGHLMVANSEYESL